MLENVRQNITRLIAAYESAVEENAELRQRVGRMDAELTSCKETIRTLNDQINSLKLKDAFTSSSADTEEAKKKIDRMIRELDKCIALMEK